MRLEKDFEICKATGELRLTYLVTDLGRTPDLHVSALVGDRLAFASACDVVRDMQRQLERELVNQLFGR